MPGISIWAEVENVHIRRGDRSLLESTGLNGVPHALPTTSVCSEPQNVTLFRNRDITGVIKVRVKRRSFWIRVSFKRREGETHRDRGEATRKQRD